MAGTFRPAGPHALRVEVGRLVHEAKLQTIRPKAPHRPQSLQPRLQPAVPKETTRAPGRKWSAIGSTAKPVEALAAPGTVLISETTHRLVAGFFETRDLGRLEVKGKTEPVRAFEVTGERTVSGRIDALDAQGLTPLVGRGRELDALREAFEGARAGHGHVAFLVGDAGMGKSRLLYEFRRLLASEPHLWIEGRCASYGTATAFLPIVDALRRYYGIEDRDDDAAAPPRSSAGSRRWAGGSRGRFPSCASSSRSPPGIRRPPPSTPPSTGRPGSAARPPAALGEYGRAISELRAALELCERIGDRAWKRVLNTLGWCFAEFGSRQRAQAYNAEAAAIAHEIGDPEIIANAEINLAANLIELGDTDRASAYLAPILAGEGRFSEPFQRWRYTMHATHALAEVAFVRREPERAAALVVEEREAARRHRSPEIEARALELHARALLDLGRRDEAEAALAEALWSPCDGRIATSSA